MAQLMRAGRVNAPAGRNFSQLVRYSSNLLTGVDFCRTVEASGVAKVGLRKHFNELRAYFKKQDTAARSMQQVFAALILELYALHV